MEEKRPIAFGGITVEARLDRMDRLEAGGHAIIDYKTGVCKVSEWMGRRLDEPQLPMYALGAGEDIAAVAFAVVKTGESKFRGVSRVPKLIPGVAALEKAGKAAKQYRGDWRLLVDAWRADLEATGRGFASGDARVDPKRGRDTCKNCDQQTLCRIAEKAPFAAGEEGDGESDE
jgi:RecB family exonuclease